MCHPRAMTQLTTIEMNREASYGVSCPFWHWHCSRVCMRSRGGAVAPLYDCAGRGGSRHLLVAAVPTLAAAPQRLIRTWRALSGGSKGATGSRQGNSGRFAA